MALVSMPAQAGMMRVQPLREGHQVQNCPVAHVGVAVTGQLLGQQRQVYLEPVNRVEQVR